ncbi:mapk-regulated corepressor-interacting protein 1-like isoform X2 [Ptychodera flava]|uniref:mapk-regulated corepressor-interacting protein 1-like isoform X2 n=1 Tax=Ptychodera flava TaxID=63121 RepID=UPI00396A02CC
MYTLNKGANKLRIDSRRGISQQFDNSDRLDSSRRELNGHATMSTPRPVFSSFGNKRRQNSYSTPTHEPVTPQHEANVRHLSEAWRRIEQELNHSRKTEREGGPIYYVEKSSNPKLEGFEPFDLDTWRIHQLTRDTPLSTS